jgi:hypothetical protein
MKRKDKMYYVREERHVRTHSREHKQKESTFRTCSVEKRNSQLLLVRCTHHHAKSQECDCAKETIDSCSESVYSATAPTLVHGTEEKMEKKKKRKSGLGGLSSALMKMMS